MVHLLETKIDTSYDDIDMKHGPVTKLDKWNTRHLKKIDNRFMSANYDVIVIFPMSGQFGAMSKSDFGRML